MSNNNNQPPPWSEAPLWAKYRAQDEDGEWCWFRYKPLKDAEMMIWDNNIHLSVKGEEQW